MLGIWYQSIHLDNILKHYDFHSHSVFHSLSICAMVKSWKPYQSWNVYHLHCYIHPPGFLGTSIKPLSSMDGLFSHVARQGRHPGAPRAGSAGDAARGGWASGAVAESFGGRGGLVLRCCPRWGKKWCERWFFLNGFYRPCRALKPRVNLQVYPLVNIYITMENHHAINGENSLFRLGNFQSLCVCLPEGNYGSWCP